MSVTLPVGGTVVIAVGAELDAGAAELDTGTAFCTGAALVVPASAVEPHAVKTNAAIMTIVTSKYLDFILVTSTHISNLLAKLTLYISYNFVLNRTC